ncbi:MAG: hypothetical protein MZV70_66470 [Desulfobacterales bacterium]|nr:hypothetical protein [Desulfobacterales bacterium]
MKGLTGFSRDSFGVPRSGHGRHGLHGFIERLPLFVNDPESQRTVSVSLGQSMCDTGGRGAGPT